MRLLTTLLLLPSALTLSAQTTVLDFEQFAAGTTITNQIPGLTFSHATVLVQGGGLNSVYPPHSGTHVIYDNGGALGFTITFNPPVTRVSGYFTHNTQLTMRAFNSSNTVVATATSPSTSNITGNSAGATPNELLQVSYAGGIASVTITGNAGGNSFTLDDLTLVQLPGIPALNTPALIGLALLLSAAGLAILRRTAPSV